MHFAKAALVYILMGRLVNVGMHACQASNYTDETAEWKAQWNAQWKE
jgi:hypothetical protein